MQGYSWADQHLRQCEPPFVAGIAAMQDPFVTGRDLRLTRLSLANGGRFRPSRLLRFPDDTLHLGAPAPSGCLRGFVAVVRFVAVTVCHGVPSFLSCPARMQPACSIS